MNSREIVLTRFCLHRDHVITTMTIIIVMIVSIILVQTNHAGLPEKLSTLGEIRQI